MNIEKMTAILKNAGFGYMESKILLEIARCQRTTSKDLQRKLGLRQPDVCIALQGLEEKELIARSPMTPFSKGRPTMMIALAKPMNEIIDGIISTQFEQIKTIELNIQALREITGVV